MNKCRYHRNHYSNEEIERLIEVQRILDMRKKYSSSLSGKNFDTKNKWKNDIIRYLDIYSANYFFYLLESKIPKCKHCNNTLTLRQYSYGAREFGFKGFKKYCDICEHNEVWKIRIKTNKECKNISDGLSPRVSSRMQGIIRKG